jgi:hypothetical protein
VGVELLEPQPAAQSESVVRIASDPSMRFSCLRRTNGNNSPTKGIVEATPHIFGFARAPAVTTPELTVTFTLPALTPSSVTEAGANAQVMFTGRLPQLNDTVCVEPPRGIILIVVVPGCPALSVKLAGWACIV